jgi:hypothetical protein
MVKWNASNRWPDRLRQTIREAKRRAIVSATLRLRREGVGIELRRGRFEIVTDGKADGSIEWHKSVEVALEPGHHTVRECGQADTRAKITLSTWPKVRSLTFAATEP